MEKKEIEIIKSILGHPMLDLKNGIICGDFTIKALHDNGEFFHYPTLYKFLAEAIDEKLARPIDLGAIQLIETLMQYGNIRPIEGVLYTLGDEYKSHKEVLKIASEWLHKNRLSDLPSDTQEGGGK